MKAGRDIEERLKKQEEKDKELQALQKRADTILEEVLEDADAEVVRDKLLEFQKVELQVRGRMKHTGYVLGASDAAEMIHKTEGAIEVLDLVTELEILVREYRDIQSLLSVFGDGIKESLGEYDVTNGVYAICKGNGGAEHSVSGVVCEDCWGVIGNWNINGKACPHMGLP